MLADIPQALLKVLIQPLAALLFDASDNDVKVAWENAIASVKLYAPKSETEVRLAIRTLILNIQANQAAAQASDPSTPAPQAIRTRSGAVSLIREADKAERRLNQLRAARRKAPEQATQAPKPEPQPQPEQTAPDNQAYRQRILEKKLAKREERDARLAAMAANLANEMK
jgi:hypothetical protein